ncbi:M20/M25/M40 family metallo-hydrolase [Alloacidobacterium dinghuense]|uniref:M20/M25/M40 family metallo-hydrolase n=1 Tax=Alloacidobacterium dinghuense TaxID=2763107 RepID=A0A7G8BFZ6_9BACT|nr:M20/M25/M40 family metallo-hydrolase [Alloacidobacterium dinghuense]QNI31466.1 M20/M25/M40 family metallo-hydrolase [Alloacidobacterium dinghuense]
MPDKRFLSRLLPAVIFFANCLYTFAQLPPVPTDVRTGFEQIRETDLRADLAFIASDALQGRMSLQPGDDAAAEWIASEFAKAGLQPQVTDSSGRKSYLQPVPLIEYRPDRKASFVALRRSESEKKWQFPDVLGGYHDNVDISAPVVFAGYGITAPELHYDDYKGIDVQGKIVLVFDHEPQENDPHSIFNGTGNTRYATTRVKAMNAQAHGAVAILIVAEPNRKHPSNQERVARIGGSATRANPIPGQALADDALHIPAAVVSDAIAAELLSTAGASPSALQAGIDKDLSPQSRALPDTTVNLHFQNLSRTTGTAYNVAGLLQGSDPALSPETILISAHHDHDGSSPNASGGLDIWHGADDNGSGTVGVVELAHAFAANPLKPKRSILFVVFAAEERGLLGSYYMAAHPLRPLDTTRAMINFDMIGRDETPSEQTNGLIEIPKDTTNRLNLIGALYSPQYNQTVVAENEYVGLVLDDRFDHENALNVFFRSDQFPFVLHDVPAFWWFTGFHPDYHHTTDTADKIDYAKMTKILKLAYLTAWQFGTEANTPKFVANPVGN